MFVRMLCRLLCCRRNSYALNCSVSGDVYACLPPRSLALCNNTMLTGTVPSTLSALAQLATNATCLGSTQLTGTLPLGVAALLPLSSNVWNKTCVTGCLLQYSGCDLVERPALVDLYSGANGAGWLHNTGWLTTNNPCSWFGVMCIGGGVTYVLSGFGGVCLRGFVDDATPYRLLLWVVTRFCGLCRGSFLCASNCPHLLVLLRSLSLASNYLSGTIPSTVLLFANIRCVPGRCMDRRYAPSPRLSVVGAVYAVF